MARRFIDDDVIKLDVGEIGALVVGRTSLAEFEQIAAIAETADQIDRVGLHRAGRGNIVDQLAAEPHLQMRFARERRAGLECQQAGLTSDQIDCLRNLDVARAGIEVDHEAAGRRMHAFVAVADALKLHGAGAGVGDKIAAAVPVIGIGDGPGASEWARIDTAAGAPRIIDNEIVPEIETIAHGRRRHRQSRAVILEDDAAADINGLRGVVAIAIGERDGGLDVRQPGGGLVEIGEAGTRDRILQRDILGNADIAVLAERERESRWINEASVGVMGGGVEAVCDAGVAVTVVAADDQSVLDEQEDFVTVRCLQAGIGTVAAVDRKRQHLRI